jgi:hypothetical protein
MSRCVRAVFSSMHVWNRPRSPNALPDPTNVNVAVMCADQLRVRMGQQTSVRRSEGFDVSAAVTM